MPALSAQDKIRLRSQHPHKISLYLSVMVPEIAYVGTIDLAGSSYAYVKVVDVTGDPLDLEGGETVFIGKSQGDDSICRRRFRYMTGDDDDIMFLDETISYYDNIVNGDYVTVYKNYELWPRFPFISVIANDDGSSNFLFYKDFNIPYAGQNYYPEPVAIMGSHRAGWLTGASVSFAFDGSDSYAIAPGAVISSYVWECDSGVIDTPTTATMNITFSAAGTYWVKLTVTDDNGKWQTSYRAVFVHTTASPPYTDFGFRSGMSGTWKQGGWDVSIEVRGNADISEFPKNALIVIWMEQYYGDEEVSIADSGNILFAGYIGEESVSRDIDTGFVMFSAATINTLMDNIYMYSVSMSAVASGETPTNWNYYRYELTTARAIHHYWKWHSTLFEICDVILPIANTSRILAQDYDEGTLYNTIETFAMEHGIFAHVCSTRQGVLHVETDIQMLNDTDRALVPTVMEITEEDRRGDTDIELYRDTQLRTHHATVTGVSGDGDPYGGQAVGAIFESRGSKLVSFERCIIDDQDHALELAGRLFGIANLFTIEARIPMAGHYYGAMPIVPQEWFTISLAAGDTKRGIVWTDEKVVVREVRFEIEPADGTIQMEIIVEPEAETYPSDILLIRGDESWNLPLPPFPLLPPWVFDFPDPPVPFAIYFGEPVRNLKNSYVPQHTEENAASAVRIYSDNVDVTDASHASMGYYRFRGPIYDGTDFYFTCRLGSTWGQGQLWRINATTGSTTLIQVADGSQLEELDGGNPVVFAPGVIAYPIRKYDNPTTSWIYRVDVMDFNIADDETGISTLFTFADDDLPFDYFYYNHQGYGATCFDVDYYIQPSYVIDPSGINNYIKEHVFRIYNYQTGLMTETRIDVASATYWNSAVNMQVRFDGIFFKNKCKMVFMSSMYDVVGADYSTNYLHWIDLDTLDIYTTKIDDRLDREGYYYNLCPDFGNGRLYYTNRDDQGVEGGDGRMYYDLDADSHTIVGGDADSDYLAQRENIFYKIEADSTVYTITGASGNVDISEVDFDQGICYQVDDVENRIWVLDVDDEVLRGFSPYGDSREIDVSGTALFPLPVAKASLQWYVSLIGDKFVVVYRHSSNTTEFYIIQGS